MKRSRLIILKSESETDYHKWLNSCKKYAESIEFSVVDLSTNNWLSNLLHSKADYYLAQPGGLAMPFKQQYDERISILVNSLHHPIYPSLNEILLYENKKFLSYWLEANEIPHPETSVFYFQREAMDFLKSTTFPIVAKANIGASGSGVHIFKNVKEAALYVREAFMGKGAKKRWGPNLAKGGLIKRGLRYISYPGDIKRKLAIYKQRKNDVQKDFVIFQEFIPHEYEWRCVRIGDSFFAHKKLVHNHKASGSLLKGYENPPFKLMDFVKEVTDRNDLTSVAIDLFETRDKGYLVNEIQCFFGQSDPYQMLVNGKPGRYINANDQWIFQEGDFNINESYDLRIQHVLELIKERGK